MKIKISYRLAYILLFFLLAFLCYQAHQWVRHFAGALLCGGFGTVTFTVAETRQPCTFPTIVTLSGPILTYGLAYVGMILLRSPQHRLFAFTLIFASFSHLRWIQNLTGRGDELVLAQQWFGIDSQPLVALFAFLVGLPPVITAFRVIANRRRWLAFAVSYLLPIPVLFVLLVGDQYLFRTTTIGMQWGSVWGIWLLVLVIDLLAVALMIFFGPRIFASRQAEDA